MKNNQPKSNRGGKREGAGRPKGVPNKATVVIKDAAREYTEKALETLAKVMVDVEQPAAARVSAANALLDRGYGKPSAVIAGDEDGGPIKTVSEIRLVGVQASVGD